MKDDKNIERFFKRRLESNDFSYQEKDWQNLEEKLDAAGIVPSENGVWLSTGKLLVSALVISSVAFFLGWYLRDNVAPPLTVVEQVSGSENNSKSLSPEHVTSDSESPKDQANQKVKAKGLPAEVTAFSTTSGAAIAEGSPAEDGHFNARTSPNQAGSDVKPFQRVNQLNKLPTKPFSLQRSADRDIILLEEEEKDIVIKPERLSFRDRWLVGLSVAPDLNSIGLVEEKLFSPKFGGQVFYRLAERWSISAGAFYNKKKYNTDGEKYSPPEGYWYYGTNGVKPSAVFGSCGVVDIPVKVYYRWIEGKRLSFHSAVGISNYFLLDEAYDFEFDQPNPGGQEGWYTEENSSVLAGVVNASVLISIPISERSALLAEPYVQAPLTKIGWGNVDLYSTGLLVTFRYKLFRTTTQPKHKNKSVTYHHKPLKTHDYESF